MAEGFRSPWSNTDYVCLCRIVLLGGEVRTQRSKSTAAFVTEYCITHLLLSFPTEERWGQIESVGEGSVVCVPLNPPPSHPEEHWCNCQFPYQHCQGAVIMQIQRHTHLFIFMLIQPHAPTPPPPPPPWQFN